MPQGARRLPPRRRASSGASLGYGLVYDPARRMRVLLLTTDLSLAERLQGELADAGIVASMEVEEPDAIVLDANVPDAAACAARFIADDAQRPIVLLSGQAPPTMPPEGISELAMLPLRPGELAVRLNLAHRRRRHAINPREKLAATAVEAAGDIVEITSPEPAFEYVNPAFVRTLGYTFEEVIGRSPGAVMRSDQHDAGYFRKIDETLLRGDTWKGLLISRAKDGRLVYLDSTIAPIYDDEGNVTHHIAVKRDITQRLRAENELRRINAELEHARDAALEASRAKSEFLANMSHELRTPLNAIIGYSEMLEEDLAGPAAAAQREDVRRIRSAGRHLLELIDGILDASRIEAGKLVLEAGWFELAELIDEVVSAAQPLMLKNSNTLVVDVGADLGAMYSDRKRLRQVLMNLLSNAAKFTTGGTVTLTARRREEGTGQAWIDFEVADNGVGIDSARMDKLFQPFVQVDSTTTRKHGGSGLGLAISQRLCQLMGGDIDARSEPGRATVFTVTLPLQRAPRDA